MTSRITTARISATVAIVALFAIPAYASSQSPAPTIELAQAEQADPDLAAYAAATVKVLQIQQNMNQQMNNAEGEDLSNIQTEAQAAMVAAVESEGLTVEKYNEIAELTRNDPETAETVERLVRQQLGG